MIAFIAVPPIGTESVVDESHGLTARLRARARVGRWEVERAGAFGVDELSLRARPQPLPEPLPARPQRSEAGSGRKGPQTLPCIEAAAVEETLDRCGSGFTAWLSHSQPPPINRAVGRAGFGQWLQTLRQIEETAAGSG